MYVLEYVRSYIIIHELYKYINPINTSTIPRYKVTCVDMCTRMWPHKKNVKICCMAKYLFVQNTKSTLFYLSSQHQSDLLPQHIVVRLHDLFPGQQDNHGVRCTATVKSTKTAPERQHAFVFENFRSAINHTRVRYFTIGQRFHVLKTCLDHVKGQGKIRTKKTGGTRTC